MECTLYCDHKPLAPFFTTEMSSPILDLQVLELQQFNIKFEDIQGKKNVVADAISRLRTFGLYQDHDNEEIQPSLEDAVENNVKEIHNIELTPKIPANTNIDKLNLNLDRKNNYMTNSAKRR